MHIVSSLSAMCWFSLVAEGSVEDDCDGADGVHNDDVHGEVLCWFVGMLDPWNEVFHCRDVSDTSLRWTTPTS